MITDSLPTEISSTEAPQPAMARPVAAAPMDVQPSVKPGEFPVVFFDGVCGLCNRWVDFLLKWDRTQMFRFSPLQGETARDWLQISPEQPLNSVVLVDESGIHRKSDAVWRMLLRVGGRWALPAWLLRLTPRFVRNVGYDFVARHRYRWFGRKESCRLPIPAERARFLP